MRKSTPREKLGRLVAGVDSGNFELESFKPIPVVQQNLVVIEIVLKRTPKRLEPGSGNPKPKRQPPTSFAKQVRELIFDDEVTGQRWADG